MSDELRVNPKTGKPWETIEQAQRAFANMNLDPDVWNIVDMQDGFVIEKAVATLRRMQEAVVEDRVDHRLQSYANEEYFWVMFAARQHANDSENVELSHNGDRITVQREKLVPLPQRFLHVADCAVQRVFAPTERGTTPYKVAGVIRRRPYRKEGPATRADFEKYLREGGEITKSAIKAIADQAG